MKHAVAWALIFLMMPALIMPFIPNAAATLDQPQYISNTVGNSGAAVSSHIITVPSSGAVGDLIVSCLSVNGAPTVTWPVNWFGVTTTSSGATVTVSCYYRFDNGAFGNTFTVTTGTAQGDANITYRIRNARTGSSPLINTPVTGTATAPNTNTLVATTDELRMTVVVVGWSAGTVSTSVYGPGLTSYTPIYPGLQSQWNNAAGTGIFSAYQISAVDVMPTVQLNMASSVISVRFLMAIRPQIVTIGQTIDFTLSWILGIMLILLALLGFVRAPVALFLAGTIGILLAMELWTQIANLTITVILMGVSVFLVLWGISEIRE